MLSENYDVIITGAGPAGATLALLLARSGIKTLLIEQDATFKKEFRGPAYQPAVLDIFKEIGILDDILKIPHDRLSTISVHEQGKTLASVNFEELRPKSFAIALHQGPFLKRLVELGAESPEFSFIGGASVKGLVEKEGGYAGVIVQYQGEEYAISSRLVVGADGRFSTLRTLAGISLSSSKQSFDLLWFDYPSNDTLPYQLGLEFSDEGLLLFIPQEKKMIRVGWILEKGAYALLQKEGNEKFHARLKKAKPELTNPPPLSECAFLDVKLAIADEWIKKGLLLIGDAAHIASPVGAQGNKLAIEDAALVHPLIVEAFKTPGIVKPSSFESYEKKRRPVIEEIFKIQERMGKGIFFIRKFPFMRKWVIPLFFRFISKRVLKRFAFGNVAVATHLLKQDKHRYVPLTVIKVVQETPDATSFYLSVPPHEKERFHYKAGQFVTIRVLDHAHLYKRCYTLSSSPHDPDLRITVKRIKGGTVSNDLNDVLQVGDLLFVQPPTGQFVVSENPKTPLAFIGAGSGITPMISFIRHLKNVAPSLPLYLLDINHDSSSILFAKEFDALQKTFPSTFFLKHHLTTEKGRITKNELIEWIRSIPSSATFYLCGPDPLMQLSKEALRACQIPPERVLTERYLSLPEAFEPQTEENSTLAPVESLVTVCIRGQEHTFSCPPKKTLLDAAIEEDLDPPFSCREGVCATCRAALLEGNVTMQHPLALTEEEKAKGYILTCQAKALTPICKVSYDI